MFAVLRDHDAMLRRQAREFGGYEIKSAGDGFLFAFQSAGRALHCAVGIQRALDAYNEAHTEEPLRIRIGLHTGETVREANDFFGRSVVMAARIADQARGGEILVSRLVKELTESAGDLRFGQGRSVELRGLAGTHQLFSLDWNGSGAPCSGADA